MTATLDRPRILTDNERYGSQQAPPDDGGAWIVLDNHDMSICCVCGNRQAAEDAVYSKAAENQRTLDSYTLSVWHIHDTYPKEEE